MTPKQQAAMQQALEALEHHTAIKHPQQICYRDDAIDALRAALAEPEQTAMDDALAAGDGVILNEQAVLLRECRLAIDDLLRDKPMLAAKLCGTQTLGNLRAMLYDYRPRGVFGWNKS